MSLRPNLSEVKYSGYGVASSTDLVAPASGLQLMIWYAQATNNSGASCDVGLMQKNGIANSYLYFGQIDASEDPDFVDKTSELTSGTAVDIFTGTNDDGFMVQYAHRYGFIGINVSTSNTGGSFSYEYWNGSSFTALSTISVPDYSSTGWGGVVFDPPIDWVSGDDAGGFTNLFTIKVTSTTGPAGAVAIDDLFVGRWLSYKRNVVDNGSLSIEFDQDKPLILEFGESIVPYFSTISSSNTATVAYTNV